MLRVLVLTSLLFVIAGCAPQNLSYNDILARDEIIEQETLFFSDATLVSLTPYVLQIEYHSPDGRAFLWYPGNRSVNEGQWDIRARRDSMDLMICYRYQTSTNNRPFGSRRDGASCRGIIASKRDSNWYTGDPYDLADGSIPFVLPKGPDALGQVIARTGINPANLARKN